MDSANQETGEEQYKVNTLTNQGIKLKCYSVILWKTSWKSQETIGIRFKLLEETEYSQINNSEFKKYFSDCLKYVEKKIYNLSNDISLGFRNLENHIEQNKPILIENDCVILKDEIHELSWMHILLSNTMLNGELTQESDFTKQPVNLKNIILNIGEHSSFFCNKKNNDLEIAFADTFPECIRTYHKAISQMVYSFIMLFNELMQNISIEILCKNENVLTENQIITMRFRIVMKRPRLDSLKPDILDGSVHSPGLSEMDNFLINSINKCIAFLGANMDVQVNSLQRGAFEVIFILLFISLISPNSRFILTQKVVQLIQKIIFC